MKSNKKKDVVPNDDFLAQEAKQASEQAADYTLDIPEDEIWTYQIEGLQAPHVAQPFKNAGIKKFVVVIVLLLAISASIFMSVRAVHNDEYKYKELDDGTYELVKYTNPGNVTDVTIDYVVDLETGEKDTTKPITVIHEYAFNCDEQIRTITFGKDVKQIDSKSIYSCWSLRNVWIDDDNANFCDVDGVVYSKDMTQAIHYPTAHDMQLMIENGYATEEIADDGSRKFISKVTDENGNLTDDKGNNLVERVWGTNKLYDEQWYQTYNKTCRTYVIPSTVTSINNMSFAYSDIVDLYIPEGVTYMGNMALFKNTALTNIYTYKCDEPVNDTTYRAIDSMTEIYPSLPEGLEFMGADCLYYTRGLSYMYIPSSIKEIKHHALWESCYTEDKELKGVTVINYGGDQAAFDKVKTGDQWRAQYDYMLFKKSVGINYNAQRESQLAANVYRQYYWSIQWINTNCSDEVKANSSYLVKDLNGDSLPELVIRRYDEDSKKTQDKILTINYGYLDDYKGKADYSGDTFSKLDDNAQLDNILDTVKEVLDPSLSGSIK